MTWIKRDGVKILEDDVYGRYRRSEAVTRELVDCNQPISKTPIMEKVALSCMNSIVIGTNENYNVNTVPENRHFKFGLKLPYVDSPVIPAEGIEYDLDTNMVTYVPYDYKSVHFPLAPSQTFTFLKKMIEYMSMFKKARIVKGPQIDLTNFQGQEIAFLGQRQINQLNTNYLNMADSGEGCTLRVVAGKVTVHDDIQQIYLWVPERGAPQANHGSKYFYIFYDKKPTYVNPTLDGLEIKLYPERNYDSTTLAEDNIMLDSTCTNRNRKKSEYRNTFYDIVKDIIKIGSKRHEDFRTVPFGEVFNTITTQNSCGTKQRANRCGSVDPQTGKTFSSIEFEVDDTPGSYTCYFAGVESKNSITLPLPTTTTTTTEATTTRVTVPPPPTTQKPVVVPVTTKPPSQENNKKPVTKTMEDYKLEELVKFRDELNKTGAILKPIPDLAPGYHWTIIGIGAGVAVGFYYLL